MSYLDRKFGTGAPKYFAIGFLIFVGVGLGVGINWIVGACWLALFVVIFYTQRNTK
jgi:hypothetical protein